MTILLLEILKSDIPDNFRIEFYLLIIDTIIDDFSQRFDFHLA